MAYTTRLTIHQRFSILLVMILLATTQFACQQQDPGIESLPESEPVLRPDGMWLSDGYGYFAEIDSESFTLYEVTAISCVPSAHELVRESVDDDGTWHLGAADGSAAARLVPETESTLRLQQIGIASDILLRRSASRPVTCGQTPGNTALENFDVFWTTYKEHYPIFDLKAMNWDDVRADVRPRISDTTTDEDLFALLAGMISPLEDAHTGLVAESLELNFRGLRTDPALAGITTVDQARARLEQRFGQALDIIESQYIQGELRSFCAGHLHFGELPDGIVYLRLDQEGGYTDEPEFAAQLATLESALDTVFTASREARGLILDVRKNYGGSDILSLALASRLANQEYFAYAKVARLDADDPGVFTPPQERRVPVSARPGFSGPVIQLIGPYTISAGETLTQALMGREPHIVRVGENTQGVFSDTLGRQLPNGWQFWLPNELFLTQEGDYFDGPGIPPDVRVPVFRPDDLAAGRDPALEKAMEILQGQ